MRIDILTLFPNQFTSVFQESIIKIAQEKNLLEINLINWRIFAQDSHKTVDDRPYGGGSGMVLKVDVIDQALTDLKNSNLSKKPYVILLSPQGKTFSQEKAKKLTNYEWLILICGHYEGIDERVIENLIDEELSIGDYVLSGGEIGAMVVVDAIARLIPQVLGNSKSTKTESFENGLLEYPQYTRPEEYKNWKVPPILLGGDHSAIAKWRLEKAHEKTKKIRPDLLKED